jgi:hypothetical protein
MKLRELQIAKTAEFTEQYRRNCKEQIESISCNRIENSTKRGKY